jgi:hypothetical protein
MTMTNRTARNKSGHVWMAAIFSSLLLTCCNSPSNKEPVAARAEPQSTAAPKSAQQDLTPELAELTASEEVFTLTPDTAPQKLSKFAKLEADTNPELKQVSPDSRYLIGANPASGIKWIQLEFRHNGSGNDNSSWKLRNAYFAFSRKEGDSGQIYKDLKTVLAARLAKLGRQDKETPDTGVEWHLKSGHEVQLQNGEFENPFAKEEQQVALLGMYSEDIKPD